jgi:E2F/DP family winged-helix DNA-binding domain
MRTPEVQDLRPTCAGRRISAAHPACKSELMMLCDRFIRKFGRLAPDGGPSEIMLNNVATQLGVPRRRLYDIINVMEAVEVRV